MKRILLVGVICLVFIISASVSDRAIANAANPRGDLGWKVEPLIQDADVRNVAVGYEYYLRPPQVDFYDTDADQYRQATYVGPGNGICGPGDEWYCIDLPTMWGPYLDVANFRSPDNEYFEQGKAHYDSVENALHIDTIYRYMHDGTGYASYIVLDLDNFYGGGEMVYPPSLAYDADHKAHIVIFVDALYVDYLIYAHEVGTTGNSCTEYGGSDRWECEIIITAASFVADPSIAIDAAGIPRIVYYDQENHDLAYAYPYNDPDLANCGPNDDWRCITIETAGDTGRYPVIAIDDARYIAYYNYTTGQLMVAEFVSSGGNCGNDWIGYGFANRWQCDAIESVGTGLTKMGLSLVVDGTQPIVAYRDGNDYSQFTVKVAQTAYRMGMDYGNCGPETPFSSWYCQTIAMGPYNLGGEIDMTINPAGAIFMAYLEDDDADYQTHLWVARQYFEGFLPLLEK